MCICMCVSIVLACVPLGAHACHIFVCICAASMSALLREDIMKDKKTNDETNVEGSTLFY